MLKLMIFSSMDCAPKNSTKSAVLRRKGKLDTLIDMHEGTDSVKESKLDVLQSQLDKFKMKDGEGVAKMYSRLLSLQMRLTAWEAKR